MIGCSTLTLYSENALKMKILRNNLTDKINNTIVSVTIRPHSSQSQFYTIKEIKCKQSVEINS